MYSLDILLTVWKTVAAFSYRQYIQDCRESVFHRNKPLIVK